MKRRLYKDTEEWRNTRYQEEQEEETLLESIALAVVLIVGGMAITLMLGLLML